jgi:hypothetical protein
MFGSLGLVFAVLAAVPQLGLGLERAMGILGAVHDLAVRVPVCDGIQSR